MKITLVIALVLALVMALFAVQNAQVTEVGFFGWTFNGPLVVILIVTFGAGVLTALLAVLPGSVRKSVEISRHKSRTKEAHKKLEALEKEAAAKEAKGTQEVPKP